MPYNSTPDMVPIKQIKRVAILCYTLAIVLAVVISCFLLFITLGRIADKKESLLLESANKNIARAAESYIKNCESECTDVFVNEIISSYAPYTALEKNTDVVEYEQRKNEIKSELSKISAGKCYNDFFIIYSNSDVIGNVSQGATDIAANEGYKAYSEALGDSSDRWTFGSFAGLSKIYYFRRVNSSSIFVMSCYIDNLRVIFPAHTKGTAVNYILADDKGSVIYSDYDDLTTGNKVPKKYASLFKSDSEVVIDDFYIASRIKMETGWTVYTITKNSDFIPNYTIIITIATIALSIVVLISIITGMLVFFPSSKLSEQLTGGEYLDTITGTLNEYGLDEMISDMLETSLVGSTYAFIMIGIKDSEQIKSTISLRYWNDIRFNLAEKAESFFEGRKHHIGRAYDDYIVVFADYSEFDLFKAHDELSRGCEQLYKSFENFAVGKDGALKLSVAIGASVYPDHGDDFDTLLSKARMAYKDADKKQKNCFSVYKNRSADENGKGGSK